MNVEERPLQKKASTARVVRVAAIQLGPCTMDVAENLRRADDLLAQALDYRPDIVCYPELFQTYFFAVNQYADARKFFEPIPGPTSEHLAEQARKHGIHIIAGIGEITEGGQQYNSAVILDPRGEIVGRYRKTHIPLIVSELDHRRTYEKHYFREGDLGLPVFPLVPAKVGILICYDRHFSEAFRVEALGGAEIIFLPTGARTWERAWRSGMWEMMLRVRAYENGVYIVGVNRAGREDQTQYLGRSIIVSPQAGEVLALSEKDADDVVCAELDLDLLAKVHEDLPIVRDRRPDLYGALARMGN